MKDKLEIFISILFKKASKKVLLGGFNEFQGHKVDEGHISNFL